MQAITTGTVSRRTRESIKMAKKQKYRLQVLVTLKEKAKKQAEIALARAIMALKAEEEKLKKLEAEKLKIEERIAKERREMHDEVASGQAKAKDPQVRMNFLRKLKEDLEELERKIVEQKEAIHQAKLKVARARQDYILAAQELNMMEKHRELWEKKNKKILDDKENKVLGELGQVIHQMRR